MGVYLPECRRCGVTPSLPALPPVLSLKAPIIDVEYFSVCLWYGAA